MNEKKSLLEVIRENIVNGELPDTFSLPKDDNGDPNKIKWADGAEEGVMIYHMGRTQISDEQLQIVADAFSFAGDTEKVVSKMKEFFEKASPIGSIDAIQRYIFDHTDILDPNVIHNLGVECLHSDDAAIVKFGLMLIEIFNEPDEELKDMIRTLGLSNEFSLFAIFNIMTWTNGNNEVFELAKKVRGWGRIHAVERLEPETEEIKDWLLAEGINNEVVKDYSALDVYQKAGIASLLQNDITDIQLDQIADVLNSMFSEGPVKGISGLSEDESKSMLGDFISQSGRHPLTLNICEVILTISEDERFKDLSPKCNEIINSSECRELIEKELENGNAVDLAKAAGITYKEKIFEYVKSDFDKGYYKIQSLMDDDEYREQIVELVRNKLPLAQMTGEPMLENGYSEKYADHNKLAYLVQFLANYPLCGTDLILVSLKMPTIQCRMQAVKAISEWCKIKNCSLSELSQDFAEALKQLRSVEVHDQIKNAIDEALSYQP